MLKKILFLAISTLLFIVPVLAQDVPDEIEDYDGDWDAIIEQLDDSGYLDEDDGSLFYEDNRLRFEEDDELFIQFDDDEITDFVMAATLQMKPADTGDYEFCMLTYRDNFDEGYLGSGIDVVETVVLYDVIFDSDDDSLIEREDHDEDVDEEIHLIIIALDDEITVYQDGELVIEEDDLTVREGVVGLYRSEETDCDADDVWVWEIEGVEHSSSNSDSDDSNDSDESSLPSEIENYDAASESVIQQFIEAGVLGSGNAFLFGEDYTFIGASGSSFFPLGRGRNRTDVVLGAQLTFNAQSSNYEQCGLILRLNDARDPAQDFLLVGIDSDGDLFIQNSSFDDDDTFDFVSLDVDVDDPHHLILLARGDKLDVYVDGELVLEDYSVYEERGIFGIGQFTDSTASECTARNLWVYDTPFFEPGVCNVLASGTVNKRSGPGTDNDRAGQMSSGETLEVVSQTEGSDGYIWYELEDDSYVREDIISIVGDCNDIEEN